jgi:hypothetical protein
MHVRQPSLLFSQMRRLVSWASFTITFADYRLHTWRNAKHRSHSMARYIPQLSHLIEPLRSSCSSSFTRDFFFARKIARAESSDR